jgi:hypothetical protein
MHYGFVTKYRPSLPNCNAVPNIVGYWEIIDFCREAKAEGYDLKPLHLLPEGLSGFIAQKSSWQGSRRSGPKQVEAYFLCYPVFGASLECDSKKLDSSSWQAELEEHQPHGDYCYVYRAAESLESVFICYCMASEGKSIMRRTSYKELVQMEKRADKMVEAMMSDNEDN